MFHWLAPDAPLADTARMSWDNMYTLQKMGVRYTEPAGFIKDRKHARECFKDNVTLSRAFSSCLVGNRFTSEDGEVVLFAPVDRLLTAQDSIEINRLFKGSIKSLNQFHTY